MSRPAGGDLVMMEPGDVVVADGFNPRSAVDGEAQAELVASIRELGILNPLTGNDAGDGAVRLVDGHRRLQAAVELGLERVPVVVRFDADEADLARALVLNLRRQGLNPIDEARGLKDLIDGGRTVGEVAQLVGCSTDRVAARVKLLHLPAGVQDGIAERDIPVTTAGMLSRVADVSTDVADAIGRALAAGDITARDLAEDPYTALCDVLSSDDAPFAVQHARIVAHDPVRYLDDQGFTRDRFGDLYDAAEKWAAASPSSYDSVTLSRDDVDAARAYGCVVDVNDDEPGYGWVTDPVWCADRLQMLLEKDMARLEVKARERAKAAGVAPGDIGDDPDKQARQAERAKRDKQRSTAVKVNAELGAKGWEARASEEPLTVEECQILAHLVLQAWDDTAAQGARLCDPENRTETTSTTKAGKTTTKVTYRDRQDVLEELADQITKARTPQEAVRRILIPLLWGWHADQNAVAQSDRRGMVMPGMWSYGPARQKVIPDLVHSAAEWLPAKTRKELTSAIAARDAHVTEDGEG